MRHEKKILKNCENSANGLKDIKICLLFKKANEVSGTEGWTCKTKVVSINGQKVKKPEKDQEKNVA